MQTYDASRPVGHFRMHIRVVCALMIREMATRFGNKPGGYIWTLLDPIAYISFLTLVFGAIAHTPALGTSFVLFFATGYIAFQFYSAVASYLNGAVKANRALLNYPSVAPIDAIAARYILQFGTTTAAAVIVLSAITFTARVPLILDWVAIFEAAFLASIIALGAALFNNAMFGKYPFYERVFNIISRPLFMISGVFFLPDAIPAPYRDVLMFNPLCHVIMRFRSGFYAEYGPQALDMSYVYMFSSVMLFVGMFVFTSSRSSLRSE